MQKILSSHLRNFNRYRLYYSAVINDNLYTKAKPSTRLYFNSFSLKSKSNFNHYKDKNTKIVYAVTLASLFEYLGLTEEEEDSELIQVIKRGELSYIREQYNKSEQLFHVALKIAQELQNEDAVTFIYDRLANIAFDTNQYEKARKLFIEVMDRLFRKGIAEDDLRVIHISFKLAKIFENMRDYVGAESGYDYCFQKLKPKLSQKNDDYETAKALFKTLLNGYAYFHYNIGNLDKALKLFMKTYEVSVDLNGEKLEENVLLLNNIGTIYKHKGDIELALSYFHRAEIIGKEFPEMSNFYFVYLNLAYCYIEKGIQTEAKKYCDRAKVNAERHGREDGLQEAEECFLKANEAVMKEK